MLNNPLFRLRLKDLQLLRAIASVRSLTVLAQSMGVSQPALSRSLREIEEQLGIVVFSRDKTARLAPTPIGELVLERIQSLISDAASLQEEIDTFKQGSGGHLRLGIIPYIPRELVLSIVRQLTGVEYGMTVSTYEASTEQLVKALTQREIDAVLGRITV